MMFEKSPHPSVCNYLEALLSEVQAGGPLAAPIAQWEFARWTLRLACSGYVASDAALREIRVGFLHALRQLVSPDAMESLQNELGDQLHWDRNSPWFKDDYTPWADTMREFIASVGAVATSY